MTDRGDVYRDGFLALRDLTVHTQTCMRCLRMGTVRAAPCPVWTEATERIKAANLLWVEETSVGQTNSAVLRSGDDEYASDARRQPAIVVEGVIA